MLDLRPDLNPTWRAFNRLPTKGGGRAVMFVSACSGEGTSSVSASFAMLAAQRSQRAVWLIDLDLTGNIQFTAFSKGPFSGVLGGLGRAHNADLGDKSFYTLHPSNADEQDKSAPQLFNVYRVGDSRLLVSRFRTDRLAVGQQVKIRTGAAYWKHIRTIADWIIVDAPALEQSGAALAVCSQMDATSLVVRADKTPTGLVSRAGQEIEGHGGQCFGMVMNQVRADARFADQFAG